MKYFLPKWIAGCAIVLFPTFCSLPNALADTQNTSTSNANEVNLTPLATIQTTTTGVPDPIFEQLEAKYQKEPVTSLTGWVGYAHQSGRTITLTFPNAVDVHHIDITMRQDAAEGIYLPNTVTFEVKEGDDWYTLSSMQPTIPQSSPTDQTETFSFHSHHGVEANAIRVTFPVGVFVFARGLTVTGSTAQQGEYVSWNQRLLVSPTIYGKYALSATSGDEYGIKNMLIIYTGAYGRQGTWTEQDFLPMIGYVNDSGYIDSPMFDTILFTPYSKVPMTREGITDYLRNLFAPNQQLAALNAAVGYTNQLGTLYRPGYKEKVVLNIPYFPLGNTDFGQIDGKNISFAATAADVNAIAARSAALQWYLSELMSRWKQANFQNLQLVGLYWNDEQINETDPGEVALLTQAVKDANQYFLPVFWIPYYGANEESLWKTLGFSAAWLQPNYIEQGADAPISRIQDAIQTVNRHTMGIEIELTSLNQTDSALYRTFLQQLSLSNFDGNNVSHVFYDGSKLLLQAARSSNLQEREIYDETANFIHGIFMP